MNAPIVERLALADVEIVARAIERAWSRNHASIKSDPDIAWRVWVPEAQAALEASHHAELVTSNYALRDANRAYVETIGEARKTIRDLMEALEVTLEQLRDLEAYIADPTLGYDFIKLGVAKDKAKTVLAKIGGGA